ncbi:hypothetical protein COZ62_01515, partial [Candidatus Berkelbacteria bacterium CG_4_8_14_3_um_filter_39_27]
KKGETAHFDNSTRVSDNHAFCFYFSSSKTWLKPKMRDGHFRQKPRNWCWKIEVRKGGVGYENMVAMVQPRILQSK